MEIKINKEIRDYKETVFFGLTMRQFCCSILAVGMAVGLYFFLKPYLGTETVSWVCILGAVPFAALGFVSYHGMTCEQFLWAWLRSELIEPRQLRFEANNLHYEMLRDVLAAQEQERLGRKHRKKRSDSKENHRHENTE